MSALRQACCCLQVKLCDPRLSTSRVRCSLERCYYPLTLTFIMSISCSPYLTNHVIETSVACWSGSVNGSLSVAGDLATVEQVGLCVDMSEGLSVS